jgi:catechol 2,3-dioxygenase-like lactoylglutathione lyase family enzyme
MRYKILLALLSITSPALCGQDAVVRPKITGIDHVSFFTTVPEGVAHLYHDVLGLASAHPQEPGEILRYMVGKQWVGFRNAPDPQALDRMDHVAFATDNVAALQRYLAKKGVTAPEGIERRQDGSRSFRVKDPEGRNIEFVERAKGLLQEKPDAEAASRRMIHAGFIVRDREAEDAFYKDILGFHVYWHGGMQPGRTDWCAMQVPDGTDWVEYMLNVPAQPERRQAGVMNHISLGVENMQQAAKTLESHGWQPHGAEVAKIGRDGKWQLNLFDPDLTRVELMEFRPMEKPCCSDFQGPHPGPDR